MKKIFSLIMLLGLVSSCSEPLYKQGDCIKGSSLTFVVSSADSLRTHYGLMVIAPETSVVFGKYISIRRRVADRAYKKVKCPYGI